jgi:hypothetical protein
MLLSCEESSLTESGRIYATQTKLAIFKQGVDSGVLGVYAKIPISFALFSAMRDWQCFDADTGQDSAREIREHFI